MGLRDGTVRTVIATNALELGIDIGGLGSSILVGYPGTISSAWQQAGRAGRGEAPAAAVLVTTANPLDQFLAHHPDYFFGRSPEQGLINPDHLLILLEHLRCAVFELPFEKGDGFGSLPPETVDEFLQFLIADRQAHESQDKVYWMADSYPAANVSLRSASPENILLQVDEGQAPRVLGEVDLASAPWLVHPRAIYLHEGQQYYVQELNFETHTATLIPVALDYYTDPVRQSDVQLITLSAQAEVSGGDKSWGEIQVTTRVEGFRKLRWYTHEHLGMEPLDLPSQDIQTLGYWLSISIEIVESLSEDGLWTNAPNDYGPEWQKIRERVRARDEYRCQVCGRPEVGRQHDVHHKVPFRMFLKGTPTSPDGGMQSRETLQSAIARANQLTNLITLCPECHKRAEANVRVRSGLAGLGYVLSNLAPLFLMCDPGDLGLHSDPQSSLAEGRPVVVLYDNLPGGIGFSQKLFELHDELMARALELVEQCACLDGCPSCVGPGGENGMGGKPESIAILKALVK